MKLTLGEISRLVGGELSGDPGVVIVGISGIKEAKEGEITFLANTKYSPLLVTTQASAVITSKEITSSSKPIIRTDNPSLAFTKVAEVLLAYKVRHPAGIHQAAVISAQAILGKNVGVGACAVIEAGAQVGDNTVIYPGVYLGHDSRVGRDCLIYSNVSIRERVRIGDRVIIHSGAVLGSDGFGFADVGGVREKIPQLGTVVVEDDVEIGANVTIDRARFEKTLIGSGTKIDNLVQIAHNVITGKSCIIVAQAGISGSTILGERVIIAGQAGIAGHCKIGDKAIVSAQAGVTKDVPAGVQVSGYPAKPHAIAKRINAFVQGLPQLHKQIKALEQKICRLQADREQKKDK